MNEREIVISWHGKVIARVVLRAQPEQHWPDGGISAANLQALMLLAWITVFALMLGACFIFKLWLETNGVQLPITLPPRIGE